MDRNRGGRPRHPDVLTPAEWRVLEALREGGTNAEIGARLGLSLDTVKYHISNMLAKLELRDRRALASWRPAEPRGRLRGAFAVPAAAIAAVARPIVWVGAATAAVAGVVVGVVAVVALVAVALVVAGGEGDESLVATPPATSAVAPAAGAAVAASAVPGLCATPTDPTCIRAVYLGAPDDYAQVPDIPADALLTPGSDGRYVVERGQQVTVVTAAPLPSGWMRFYLERTPSGTPSPVSASQLIPSVGTTYTFTVTDDERGGSVITFDLTAARPHPVRPTHKPVLGDVVVTTEFLVPTLRYNRLDTTGAATMAGSYAFLWTAGDTSDSREVLYSASGAVELRVHRTDASGVSRAALYDAVQVGDAFDFRSNGVDCGRRFKVTSVSTSANPRVFGIESVRGYGGRCAGAVAHSVDFIWRVRPGLRGADGVRVVLADEPVGYGTYRLYRGLDFTFDVPSGAQVIVRGVYGGEHDRAVVLIDAATGSQLDIKADTGGELGRLTSSSQADALFDQIMASIRRVD